MKNLTVMVCLVLVCLGTGCNRRESGKLSISSIDLKNPGSVGPPIEYWATRLSEHSNMGVKRMKQSLWEEAIAEFDLAVQDKTDDHNSYFNAGLCCEMLKDKKRAAGYYNKAIELGSENKYYAAYNRVTQ